MAITASLPGVAVDIIANHDVLEQYQDLEEFDTYDTTTSYIEAVSDASFSIRFTITTSPWPKTSLLAKICLDGRLVQSIAMMEKDFHPDKTTYLVDGARSGGVDGCFLQKFRFSELSIDTENMFPLAEQEMECLAGVGNIVVEIHQFNNFQFCKMSSGPLQHSKAIGLARVPETALKGQDVTHQTILQEPQRVPRVQELIPEIINLRKFPVATFRFKYRSKDALKMLFVIPRSPSPAPLHVRDVEKVTATRTYDILSPLREYASTANMVKHNDVRRGEDDSRPGPVVDDDEVIFISSRPVRGMQAFNSDEVGIIDLT